MRTRALWMAILLSLGLPQWAAAEVVFVPAGFGYSNALSQIEVPPEHAASVAAPVFVACQGFVEVDGALTDASCVLNDSAKYRAFIDAVVTSIPNQYFLPATVDGDPVRVFMNFGVLFNCNATKCLSVPVRNHLTHSKEHGLAYVDPQPILQSDDWYDYFELKLEWTRQGMKTRDELPSWHIPPRDSRLRDSAPIAYALGADIDVEGNASKPAVEWVIPLPNAFHMPSQVSRVFRAVAERALESFADTRFIPAFKNDEPIPLRMYERGIVHKPADEWVGGRPRFQADLQ